MQDNKSPESVPFIVFEATMTRMERQAKRLWILLISALIALVATNAAWIWYESQWQIVESTETTQTVTQDGGDNHFIGGDYNAQAESEHN